MRGRTVMENIWIRSCINGSRCSSSETTISPTRSIVGNGSHQPSVEVDSWMLEELGSQSAEPGPAASQVGCLGSLHQSHGGRLQVELWWGRWWAESWHHQSLLDITWDMWLRYVVVHDWWFPETTITAGMVWFQLKEWTAGNRTLVALLISTSASDHW